WVVTPWSVTWLAGLGVVLAGLLLLVPRVGTGLRAASLLLIVLGTAAACVGGRMHYLKDPTHLLDVSAAIDPAAAWTLYAGVMLAGAMFLALGLLVSSLVRDQLVAALIALALGLIFVVERFWNVDTDSGGLLDR